MAVVRIHQNNNCTGQSYYLIDRRLSLKAKGLHALMLSLPKGSDYSIAALSESSKDGTESVQSALKELTKFGYFKRKQLMDVNGRFGEYQYDLFDTPEDIREDAEESS